MRNIFLMFILLIFTPSLINAAVIGLDIETDGSVTNPSSPAAQRDYTLGWKFSLSESVFLTALGTWDQGADGLNKAQEIRLWRANNDTLSPDALAFVTVEDRTATNNTPTAVSSASDQGQWLFNDKWQLADKTFSPNMGDILLSAGDYVIGADRLQDSLDPWQQGNTGILESPVLNWIEARTAGNDNFGFPERTFTGTQYFGPNLMFRSANVPEPSTLGIFVVSLAGLWLARKQRK